MSLRTKLLLITFLFMVIVVGLLTLNLAIDAASNRAREQDRNGRYLEGLATDWVREAGGDRGFVDWTDVARKLSRSSLIDNWIIVEKTPDGLVPRSHAGSTVLPQLDERDVKRLTEAIDERRTSSHQESVYIPIESQNGLYAARLDIKRDLVPSNDFRETLRGIVTIMALGTLLLLLNVYIFLNWFVLRPLKGLVDASGRVAEGDFRTTIPERGSYDEMGRLERAFNLMIDKIGSHQKGLREKITKTERRLFHAQRLSATGTLAAGIAHEINNPLAGMLTSIDTARKHGRAEPVVADTLSLVERGLEQIRNTVSALLVEARVEERALTPGDVEDVRTLLEPQATEQGQSLSWRNELAAPVRLPATPTRQILMNLLINAIQAAGRGGRVSLRIRADAEQVTVEIRNDGRSVPPDQLAHLFEPFWSGTGGSGLGLWVTYQIVEQMRGTIRVRSVPRETEFSVALPLGTAA